MLFQSIDYYLLMSGGASPVSSFYFFPCGGRTILFYRQDQNSPFSSSYLVINCKNGRWSCVPCLILGMAAATMDNERDDEITSKIKTTHFLPSSSAKEANL